MNVCIFGCISKEKKDVDVLHDIKLSLNLCSGALFFEDAMLGDNFKNRSPSVLGRCTSQNHLK